MLMPLKILLQCHKIAVQRHKKPPLITKNNSSLSTAIFHCKNL